VHENIISVAYSCFSFVHHYISYFIIIHYYILRQPYFFIRKKVLRSFNNSPFLIVSTRCDIGLSHFTWTINVISLREDGIWQSTERENTNEKFYPRTLEMCRFTLREMLYQEQ